MERPQGVADVGDEDGEIEIVPGESPQYSAGWGVNPVSGTGPPPK
ncbi:MAG TPA: hypothetical protein VFD85_11125 [Gemmatimonadales bacterium]|nr:hypothetical protein [Gemmatimonadales bacterium]